MTPPADATVARLLTHRAIFAAKPALRRIYEVWFDRLLQPLPERAVVLEVGAGPGHLADAAARRRPDLRWIASDMAAVPWNRLTADATRLPLAAGSVDAVVALDTLHHLADPRAFFTEAVRVIRPGGGLAVVEPWVTPLSYPIYRWLHQEGCDVTLDPWAPFARQGDAKTAFDGDAAVVWRLVRDTPPATWAGLGLSAPRVEALNGFAYVLSLGFRRASALPEIALPVLLALDDALAPLARVAALRAHVTWQRP